MGIKNGEDPATCPNNVTIDSGRATNTEQVMETVDCSVFWSVITLHSIQVSTSFMNAKNNLEISARTNACHRAKDYFLLNNIQARAVFQYSGIKKQYQLAVNASMKNENSPNTSLQ